MIYYVYISTNNGDTWTVSPPFGDEGFANIWLEGAEMGVFISGKIDTFMFMIKTF